MKRSFILALLLLIATSSQAVLEDASWTINTAVLDSAFVVVEVGNGDTTYAGKDATLYRSTDLTTWTGVKTWPSARAWNGLGINSDGSVFVGSTTGEIYRCIVSNDSMACTAVLTMPGNSSFRFFAKDSDDSLYIATYGSDSTYIYRSADSGVNWSSIFAATNSDSILYMGYSDITDSLYASVGAESLTGCFLVRSGDKGATWDTLGTGTGAAKISSALYTSSSRFFGNHRNSGNDILVTTDDSVFTAALALTGAEDCYVWDMTKNSSGVMFAGTVGDDSGYVNDCRLIGSNDGGTTWESLKQYPGLAAGAGVTWLSKNWTSTGYGFYVYYNGTTYTTYKFRVTPTATSPPVADPSYPMFKDLYAVSDTVCCKSTHWDTIVPSLTYVGPWTIYPFGARSEIADGLNVKVTSPYLNNGWSETFFVPMSLSLTPVWNNEPTLIKWFENAADSIAVQAAFTTCAADSVLNYQFIMLGR